MIKLCKRRKEPYWLDDLPHGLHMFVRPLDTPLYEAARSKAARMVADLLRDHAEISMAGGEVHGLPNLEDADAVSGFSQFIFARAMAELAVIRWEGVEDEDGRAVEVTPASVADLMMFHRVSEAFVVAYTRDYLEAVSEGNGSGLAPNGTSAAGPSTARDAGKTDSPVPTVG